jgi:hypothetical protein
MKIEPLESRIAPATLFAVAQNGHLIRFESTSPGVLDLDVPIAGLQNGESIAGMDFRPETGELYALGLVNGPNVGDTAGRIYKLDPATGVATQVGNAPFKSDLTDNSSWGFDFNPVSDALRVVNRDDQSFRVNPNTGALINTDTDLDDPNTTNDSITSVAYTNNFATATKTTLYGIDFSGDKLVRIGGVDGTPTPNGGVVTTIGALGSTFGANTGFDIAPDGTAWLAGVTVGADRLFTVDLTTGAISAAGAIGTDMPGLRGFAVAIPRMTISVDGKAATYLDTDGDLVTVKTSKGPFTQADFVMFSAGGAGRAQLSRLILSDDAAKFVGASITITAKKAPGGDGFVNVGWIDSTTNDLGKLSVRGDVGKITAGDGDNFGIALGGLNVRSLGVQGTSTQGLGADLLFEVKGDAGSIKILGDLRGVHTTLYDSASFFIGGNLVGGDGLQEGEISMGNVTGAFTIKGSAIGGAGPSAGGISIGNAKSFLIGGSVIAGPGSGSGQIGVTKTGVAKIGGDIRGSFGSGIVSFQEAKTVTLGGSILASENGIFGRLEVSKADSVLVRGNIVGGIFTGNAGGDFGGELDVGQVRSVVVGGSLIAGFDLSNGDVHAHGSINIETSVGSLTIKGSVVGNSTHAATINARGSGSLSPVFIGKLTVGGSVIYANILSGYSKGADLNPSDGDGSIGSVRVGGDWIASNLVAGVVDTNGDGFGNNDDDVIAVDNDPNIRSRIASIVIKGSVSGTAATGDRFAFTAQDIGSLKIGGRVVPLEPGPGDFMLLSPITNDVRIVEL